VFRRAANLIDLSGSVEWNRDQNLKFKIKSVLVLRYLFIFSRVTVSLYIAVPQCNAHNCSIFLYNTPLPFELVNRTYILIDGARSSAGDHLSRLARQHDADTSRPEDLHEVVRQAERAARQDPLPAVLRRYRLRRVAPSRPDALQRLEVDAVLLDRRRVRHRSADAEASRQADLRRPVGSLLGSRGRRRRTVQRPQQADDVLVRPRQAGDQLLVAVEGADDEADRSPQGND